VSTHRCPADGCDKQVGPLLLMCGWHWHMVPKHLQRAVYSAWDHGAGAGTKAHAAACDAAIQAVNQKLATARRDHEANRS